MKAGTQITPGDRTPATIRTLLGFVCLMLLAGILFAGLHPFHAPANQVAWVANANGVRLGENGTIVSSGVVPVPGPGITGRSIEIWAQPGLIEASSTLLGFYSPASPTRLSLSQAESDLEVRTESSSAWRSEKSWRMNIGDAFLDGKTALWTVTFGDSGTAVYRDGVLLRQSRVRPTDSTMSGQLVLGNSPIFSDSWHGVLQGLAIYDSALDQEQILRHYADWTTRKQPLYTPDDFCIALYLFNEHAGQIVYNRARPENDLYIPAKFLVLRHTILDPLWRAFNWSRGFWQDGFINVAGFMPFGFFFCAYFSARGLRSSTLAAVIVGALVSVFIELLQVLLPTRDSSMSDVINNVLGSVLGAVAHRGIFVREFNKMATEIAGRLKRRSPRLE